MSIKNDAEEILIKMLKEQEGLRLKPYVDTRGKSTIGYGRNLEEGISESEAEFMLSNDIKKCFEDAQKFSWFKTLDDNRKIVVLSMLFNLGLPKFLRFSRMISALDHKDYARAANEMLASDWAGMVGKRAMTLADIMKKGEIV